MLKDDVLTSDEEEKNSTQEYKVQPSSSKDKASIYYEEKYENVKGLYHS